MLKTVQRLLQVRWQLEQLAQHQCLYQRFSTSSSEAIGVTALRLHKKEKVGWGQLLLQTWRESCCSACILQPFDTSHKPQQL
jgi:hypothetical protein